MTHNTLLIINVLELSKHYRTEVEVPCLLLRDHRSKMSRNLEEVELELADIQPEPIRRRICMPLKIKQSFLLLLMRDLVNARKKAKTIKMALCASEGNNACACGS